MGSGGSRAGSGRKEMNPEKKRKPVTVYVSPETKALLPEVRKKGYTLGRIIDDFVKHLFADEG